MYLSEFFFKRLLDKNVVGRDILQIHVKKIFTSAETIRASIMCILEVINTSFCIN